MPTTYTPLRYPGGKTKLYSEIKPYLKQIKSKPIYIEPFAGGAGLAFKFLFCGDVQSIVLNDIDENIYLFWDACLNNTDKLCEIIQDTDVSIKEWEKQRAVLESSEAHSDIEKAFAVFYMNRCNRSGIIKGGPIGGKKQDGKYKIDARYNKLGLIKKIKAIGSLRESITVYCMDAKDFLMNVCAAFPQESTLINIDPPYVNKGPELYQNAFSCKDHEELSDVIKGLNHNWIVTYDVDDLVKSLYRDYHLRSITLSYSAGSQHTFGQELLITNINSKEKNNVL